LCFFLPAHPLLPPVQLEVSRILAAAHLVRGETFSIRGLPKTAIAFHPLET
jgi:hypothetical protein